MVNVRFLVGCSLLLALVGCRDEVRTRPGVDAGPSCGPNERPRFGECVFFCDRDTDCADGQRCNLFTGECEARPPATDAGPQLFPCTTGATRCAADNLSVEYCSESGTWTAQELCETNMPCVNGKCQICTPGVARCDPEGAQNVRVCLDDGTAERVITCASGATCSQDQCRECAPESTQCSANGKTLETCKHTSDETRTWAWTPSGDGFDGSCITQQCLSGSPPTCKAPDCFPGATRCLNAGVQEVCSSTGSWTQVPCSGASSECIGQSCVDSCAFAATQKSYFGCDYWGMTMDNAVHTFFKGGTTSGQGTGDSDFAFVVTNQTEFQGVVTVRRWFNNQEVVVKTVTLPPKTDSATKGQVTIKVPWQSLKPSTEPLGVTGRARYGYQLSSTRPMTVYQFNPLDAMKVGGTCTTASQCTQAAPAPACVNGTCRYFSYTNDASLLLPTHILGTQYVVMSSHHIKDRTCFLGVCSDAIFMNSLVSIVATQDNTQVTFKSRAKVRQGGSVAAIAKNGQATYTLQRYEVLQFSTDNDGSNLQCGANPYPFGGTELCRVDNDLTGSVVTANKPVAVFGGSDCTLTPFNVTACDHVEEQIFPFSTWGKKFVAVRSHPLRLTSQAFASPANAGHDYYKIVASCPPSQCPNGTLITFSTPPAAGDVLAPNRCLGGTSLAANNCRLAGGDFMELRSKASFTITADYPIAVGMFLAGQNATVGTPAPEQGDPSFILLPPVEQWRATYTVLAAPGIKDNYIGLAVDDTKSGEVRVDGVTVTSFTAIPGTDFKVVNVPVSVGTHSVEILPKPGSSALPAGGVIVYGFDNFVSYGYAGGLDLGSIVSGIDPGG
jgi:hypothetical protein